MLSRTQRPLSCPRTALILAIASLVGAQVATSVNAAERTKLQSRLRSGQTTRIVCFGDSITGAYYHSGGVRAWCDMLGYAIQIAEPAASLELINAGISGHTTVNALSRIDKEVLENKPNLVVVMFGMNDVTRVKLTDFRNNMKTIVNKCQAVGAAVVLCTPNSVHPNSARPNAKLAEYSDAVRQVASEHELLLVDCFKRWNDLRQEDETRWNLLMSDAIHPNMNGHREFASFIAGAITGNPVSLAEIAPLGNALAHTFDKLHSGEPVRMVAMAPMDQWLAESLRKRFPEAEFETTLWPTDGNKSVAELSQWAKQIRGLKPNLVAPAPPHDATDASASSYIKNYEWVLNYSFPFAGRGWDVAASLPLSKGIPESSHKRLALAKSIMSGKDIHFLERASGDDRDPQAIVDGWVEHQWRTWQGARNRLPERNSRVHIASQAWPHRPGPRSVEVSVYYPEGTLQSVNEQTGIMLTLHNWGGVDCGGSASPTALASRLNVIAICVNYLQSGRQASVDDHRPYDYGLLQSIDALHALAYVRDGLAAAKVSYDDARIFCTGGSGGGNVTQMANKLAPHTFACIVDMCGMKKLSDDIAFNEPGGSGLNARWSREPSSPNYLSPDAQAIRFLGHPSHLAAMKKGGAASKIIVVHGVDDRTCPFADAVEMVENMQAADLDVEAHFISKDKLDRKVFLSSGHGLGNRTEIVFRVAEKYLHSESDAAMRRQGPTDFQRKSDVVYRTPGGRYVISYQSGRPLARFEPTIK